MPRLLIFEDDHILAQTLTRAFSRRGFDVSASETVEGGLATARAKAPDMALVDLRLGDGSGLDCVRELRRMFADMAIVVLTGYASIATAVEAVRCGANHYLPKPSSVDAILAAFAGAGIDPQVEVPEAAITLKALEWETISVTLLETGYNVSECARRLGLTRRNLQRKLAALPARQLSDVSALLTS